MRKARTTRLALASVLALVVACGGSGEEPDRADGDRPAEIAPADSPPGETPPPADTVAAVPPTDTLRAVPPPVRGEAGAWTAGIVEIRPPEALPVAVLRAVRTARHEGYDRTTWEFATRRPAVHVEYVDEPVRDCGSGRPVELPGDGWLEIRFEPAAAHADGSSTIDARSVEAGLPTVLEAVVTCDFEAVLTWVLAVRSPEPYRVLLLDDPSRVAVDVRHRDEGGR